MINFLSTSHLIAQKQNFYVYGSVPNIDSGKVYVIPIVSDVRYYGENYKIDSSNIVKGKFTLKHNLSGREIYPYRIVVQSSSLKGITDLVFFEAMNQVMQIDTLGEHNAPYIIKSSVQHIMKFKYNNFFRSIVDSFNLLYNYEDSLYELSDNVVLNDKMAEIEKKRDLLMLESDRIFKIFATTHPTSPITFWKMVERHENLGYHGDFDEIFENLGDELKNSEAGKRFIEELSQSKVLAIGNIFPTIKLKDGMGKSVQTDKETFGKSYTLVDFWFTACSPCRKQFPEYKRLQNKYKSSGFQIIGISTDDQSKLKQWQNLIKSDSLNWIQFIDIGAVQSEKLGINAFPTNYLLNANGRIIRKNISINDLETLLRDNEMKLFYDNTFSREPI